MSLESEITDTIAEGINRGHTTWKIKEAILSLPEMVEMREKAGKWDIWLNRDKQVSPWISKDDPVEGWVVDDRCQCDNGMSLADSLLECPVCHGTGTITRPLTVGELLQVKFFPHHIQGADYYAVGDCICFVAELPSGGRVKLASSS